MTWLTWRQFRSQTWVAVGAIVVVGSALVIFAQVLAQMYVDSGATTCHDACEGAIRNFLTQARSGATGLIYNAAIILVYVAPALIGAFWGAPLVARELEAGTHRLAWNQSVTRTRWLATKLAIVGLAGMATMGLLTLGVIWYSHHIDQGTSEQVTPLLFGARGIVPIAYGAFAFAVGVTAGVLIRRTVPAMAVTLVVYLGAAVVMPLWVRGHLLPASNRTTPLDTSTIIGLEITNGRKLTVLGSTDMPGWVLSNQTITPAGDPFTGPPDPQYCGPDAGPRECMHWIGTLGLRQSITYQPGSHFWPLQFIEAGIFLAVAAALLLFCLQWTRRLV
jgi:ABC-type transport system involved in multi-copper enzyme maturation permease subunit